MISRFHKKGNDNDTCVQDKKNVFEYVLGGCKQTRLLILVHNAGFSIGQTTKKKHESNCPL